jgi:hypothetical protein
MNFIKQILDESPTIFGVGKLKYDFFKPFMKYNVGVTNQEDGCLWHKRRKLNEQVLDTDKEHRYTLYYNKIIKDKLNDGMPTNFNEFLQLGKIISTKIVFGDDIVHEPLYQMFSESNSIKSVIYGETTVSDDIRKSYTSYISKQIDNPIKNSLVHVSQSNRTNKHLSKLELLHQIPHWVFPINGIINSNCPRLLIMLFNSPNVLYKLVDNINGIKKNNYLRKCILELFRLNCPVNSTFRSLLKDYSFIDFTKSGKHMYKKGDQFLILNNPVLRDSIIFKEPNRYNPDRWTKELEKSYYSLMFNQGPQRCPDKELAIMLISIFIKCYLDKMGILKEKNKKIYFFPKLDNNNIPQMINPCTIVIKEVKIVY